MDNPSTKNSKDVDQFLEKLLAKKLTLNQYNHVGHTVDSALRQINMLNNTKNLDYLEYSAILSDHTYDKVIYFYNSSFVSSLTVGKNELYNHLAEFVQNRMRWKTLLFTTFDVGRMRLPDIFAKDPTFTLNTIYLVPASKSDSPTTKFYLKYPSDEHNDFTAERILQYLLKHTDLHYLPPEDGSIFFTPEDDKYFLNKDELFAPANTDASDGGDL